MASSGSTTTTTASLSTALTHPSSLPLSPSIATSSSQSSSTSSIHLTTVQAGTTGTSLSSSTSCSRDNIPAPLTLTPSSPCSSLLCTPSIESNGTNINSNNNAVTPHVVTGALSSKTNSNNNNREGSQVTIPGQPISSTSFYREQHHQSSCLATGSAVEGNLSNNNNTSLTAPSSSGLSSQVMTPTLTSSASFLTKRESYKDRKKTYQKAKKKVAEELLTTISDPTIVVAQDWLKIRGSLKGWTKVWCELKPGLILLYKSPKTHKSGVWVGTILLNVCEVIERPSKKNGFCFKLFHPLEQSIWASRGPKGESFGALIQPLPSYFLIFRATSEASGRQWMEAIELSYRCSSLLVKNTVAIAEGKALTPGVPGVSGAIGSSGTPSAFPSFLLTRAAAGGEDGEEGSPPPSAALKMNESEIESHFKDHLQDDEEGFHTDKDDDEDDDDDDEQLLSRLRDHSSDSDSDGPSLMSPTDKLDGGCIGKSSSSSAVTMRKSSSARSTENEEIVETPYVENHEATDEFGSAGDQTEEVAEENKSLLWTILKQVRPGMDLSKVVLPTFILEPRSFLEKLSDYYFHCDLLAKAGLEDDPFLRMKLVTQWYLSGFYKKPKGLKKPYNPILGETFRCYWYHPENQSRTFYVAEQISHHPPISAFHVTNRKDGFSIHGSILAKSKFYGNSVSAVLDGTARLTLLNRGEDYTLTMPYAHCKGILLGTLSLELGGKVEIRCEKTGYATEIEFKLKPFLGGHDYCNLVVGKIKLGKETLATLEGHWDTEIAIKDKKTGQHSSLWVASSEVKAKRLKRFTVPLSVQGDFESEKLWINVSKAIQAGDQVAATEEKTILEDAQRKATSERRITGEDWLPHHFIQDIMSGEWIYKHLDSRPWDPRTDVVQFERDFIIQTKTRHKTPVVAVRTNSVVSIETSVKRSKNETGKRSSTHSGHQRMKSIASKGSVESSPETNRKKYNRDTTEESGRKASLPLESSEDGVTASASAEGSGEKSCKSSAVVLLRDIRGCLKELSRESNKTSQQLQSSVDSLERHQQEILRSLRYIHPSLVTSSLSSSPSKSSSSSRVKLPLLSGMNHPPSLLKNGNLADVILIILLSILTHIIFQAITSKIF